MKIQKSKEIFDQNTIIQNINIRVFKMFMEAGRGIYENGEAGVVSTPKGANVK